MGEGLVVGLRINEGLVVVLLVKDGLVVDLLVVVLLVAVGGLVLTADGLNI